MAQRERNSRSSINRAEREQQYLQLDEDLHFQRRERSARFGGTIVLGVLLVAAVLGLFGSGPLSSAEMRSADAALLARYERFTRNRAATVLRLTIRTPPEGPIELALNSAFAEAVQIEQILPKPTQATAAAGRYAFAIATGSSDSLTNIVIRYRPESLGFMRVVASLDGSVVRFRQLVYP